MTTETSGNPRYDFTGQVAFVTGAGSGMGLATAWAFARSGAAVALADRDGQVLDRATRELVTDGIGWVARRGATPIVIRPGDVVVIAPGEEHWHGATAERFMAHIALQQADEKGEVVTWLEHVTDEEYLAGS